MARNLVVKDNALINASYNLELVDQRLILLAIIEARRAKQAIESNQFVIITASSYMNNFGTECDASYKALKEACTHLFERWFSYQKFTAKGNSEVVTSRWMQSISYVQNKAIVRLKFSDEVTPLIQNIERHFTSYELEQVAGLKSKYAVRLYEFIIAWRTTRKIPKMPLDELRNRLGVQDDEYQKIELFKRKVLDYSLKQINQKTDLKISYEQHKERRRIIAFTFIIKAPPKAKIQVKHSALLIKMPAKQRSMFASKLSHLPECSHDSYEALAYFIAKDLENPKQADFYRPLLALVGFTEK